MRGPIDFVVVGFEGNKFDGSIMKALGEAVDSGIIGLVDLSVISKDKDGNVSTLKISDVGDEYLLDFAKKHKLKESADKEDIDEVADLIENNCTAGMLVIEHLWAKPLKKAIIDANGVLLAEGRIHPDAANELSEGDK